LEDPRTLLLAGVAALRVVTSVAAGAEPELAPERPPRPRIELRPPAPGADHAWMPGRWTWLDGAYVWETGEWVERPAPRSTWVPGVWRRQRSGWLWLPGYWSCSDSLSTTSKVASSCKG
jgi:hypothetical protein